MPKVLIIWSKLAEINLFQPKLTLSAEIVSFGLFRLSAEITSHRNSLLAFGRKSFVHTLIGYKDILSLLFTDSFHWTKLLALSGRHCNLIRLLFVPLLGQDLADVLLQAVEVDAGEQLGETGHLRLGCRARRLRVFRGVIG